MYVGEFDVTKFVDSATYGTNLKGFRGSVTETALCYDMRSSPAMHSKRCTEIPDRALSQSDENHKRISYALPLRGTRACEKMKK